MRLSEPILSRIREALNVSFGQTKAYLFGSRVDDTRRGGDIDIALAAEMTREEFRRKKATFRKHLLLKNLDLKIDLLLWNRQTDALLAQEIEKNHILLNG